MEKCSEQNYKTYFNYKTISDPIYGNIELSKLEMDLLDTPAMQRLRRIKQMGFSSYVFPGGEHSRFIHSLGVLHNMGCMCDVLYQNGELTSDDISKLRAAALLHDVGHYPFSHLSEMVYSFIDGEDNNILTGGINSTETSLLSKIGNHTKRKNVDHEHLGAEVIKRDPKISTILKAAGLDPEEISQIITGEIKPTNSIVYAQLMHSSLDADRMDYLLRDSAQAGVVFGEVDYKYIINNLRKVKYNVLDLNNVPFDIEIIAVNSKAQHAVEHFFNEQIFPLCSNGAT